MFSKKCIFYTNAMSTCFDRVDIYVMGDEFYSLKISFWSISFCVLFSSIGSTYSLVLNIGRRKNNSIRWWTYSFIKAAHRNCNCCRIQTSRLLISKKEIVYVYKKILSWKESIRIITNLLTDQISRIIFAVLYLWCDHVMTGLLKSDNVE